MKKLLLCILLIFHPVVFFSQEKNGIEQFIPSQTPDVAAFSKINFLPISEYTGKPNISIPLYEIKLGSMSIPISIAYNYGGIKVDEVASSVGLGWNLNAGGAIVRQVNGLHDLKPPKSQSGFGVQGYLSDLQGDDCAQYIKREGEPDFFFASAPGLNTRFIPQLNPTYNYSSMDRDEYRLDGLDLNKQGNTIKMKAWWYNSAMQLPATSPNFSDGIIDYFPGLVSTKITNTQGFIYTFSDFSLNLSRSQVSNWDEIQPSSPIQNPLPPIEINRFVATQKLTTLFDPISNSSVYFDYNLPNDQNEFTISKGVFRLDGTLGSKNVQEITHKKRKLKKIRFDTGEIAFFYEFTRLDLPDFSENIALDNKALSKIVVKDLYGNIIKDIRFVYSNVRSVENCSAPECYRLILDEIYFIDANEEKVIPGHKFEYNTRKLPKRNSWVSDFLGFHNGAVAAPEPTILGHYIPKTYHYPNQGKYSFLPFDIGNSNYTQLPGNFSLAANATYAKAALLEKIIYPTGGYTILESASNDFKILGHTIEGGGLRIERQRIYDHDDSLEREISYEYQKEDGQTSGTIVNLPRFNDYVFKTPNSEAHDGLRIYQTQLANLKLTQSSFVGYSSVKVYETGNGYTIKNYTSPEEYPNTDATVTLPENPHDRALLRVDNGTFPDMMTDADLLRGNLKEETIFNQSGNPVARTLNTFTHKRFESVEAHNAVMDFESLNDAEGCDYAPNFMSESTWIHVERNLLTRSEKTRYHDDGNQVNTTTEYTYEAEYPFIKEQNNTNSGGSTYKTLFKYPFSNPQFDIQYTTGPKPIALPCEGESEVRIPLLARTENNMISTPFFVSEYKDRDLINNKLLLYKEFQYIPKDGSPPKDIANGIPILYSTHLNSRAILTKVNEFREDYNCTLDKDLIDFEIHSYDENANPIEISSSASTGHTVLVWGYGGKKIIAKIENATIDAISGTELSEIVSKSNADDDRTIGSDGNEGQLRTALAKLRDPNYFPNLTNAQITTFTYDPLIGVTSMTDPRGYTIYYHYDAFNRLEYVKDAEGNILNKNEYNYKN